MAHINLLPWREHAKKEQEKQFYSILAASGLTVFFIVLIISQVFQAKIDGQIQKNQYISREIQLLDIKIAEIKTLDAKKKALKKRTDVVEQLQRSRNVGTQVLDEITRIVPAGIYLLDLEKNGNTIQINGKSESNNHLANMMREIERSEFFTDAVLENITTNEAKSKLLSDFHMRIKIKGLVNNLDDAGRR